MRISTPQKRTRAWKRLNLDSSASLCTSVRCMECLLYQLYLMHEADGGGAVVSICARSAPWRQRRQRRPGPAASVELDGEEPFRDTERRSNGVRIAGGRHDIVPGGPVPYFQAQATVCARDEPSLRPVLFSSGGMEVAAGLA